MSRDWPANHTDGYIHNWLANHTRLDTVANRPVHQPRQFAAIRADWFGKYHHPFGACTADKHERVIVGQYWACWQVTCSHCIAFSISLPYSLPDLNAMTNMTVLQIIGNSLIGWCPGATRLRTISAHEAANRLRFQSVAAGGESRHSWQFVDRVCMKEAQQLCSVLKFRCRQVPSPHPAAPLIVNADCARNLVFCDRNSVGVSNWWQQF
jgi:hypothetical protein